MSAPSPSKTAAFLILEGRDAGGIITISKVPFQIGRLPGNDFVLSDDQVSRNHARVEMSKQGLVLTDLKSRNGVFVDERKIETHLLKSGDRVRMGSTILVFHPDTERAQEVLHEKIPDSPEFAVGQKVSEARAVQEEPTSIAFIGSDSSEALNAVGQISKLFSAGVPPRACASQILDVFFQVFAPDRVQLAWKDDPEIRVARSKEDGKKCEPFDLPKDLQVLSQPGVRTVRVPVQYGAGAEDRQVLYAPLKTSGETRGFIYLDRKKNQPPFESATLEEARICSEVSAGVLERSSLLHETKRLKNQILLTEKHLSPQVARMLSAKGLNIEESGLSVERREVTILFSDIKGFTPLSERLKPEELSSLLNEYFQRMVDVIIAHNGYLNKFIGDAIMAIFGAPEVHGDDASNAVAAGLSMIEAMKQFRDEIDEKKRFDIRIGINTGVVVAGNIGSDKKMEYTALGDAVNVASRLEGISPANTVTIGERTAELVKDFFDLERITGVKVKGKSAEMSVYRVLGMKSQS